ncbi:GM23218 [Drosophila sechellia]|uniref:GM23218 n=1 Tax=Drosophila sechellia TaxID=7238 RepID=B4IMA5_DROSE|nr:GM23218 [Drosophila sechellia]
MVALPSSGLIPLHFYMDRFASITPSRHTCKLAVIPSGDYGTGLDIRFPVRLDDYGFRV